MHNGYVVSGLYPFEVKPFELLGAFPVALGTIRPSIGERGGHCMTETTSTLGTRPRNRTTIALAILLTIAPLAGGTALFDDGTIGTSGDCNEAEEPEEGCIDWVARSNSPGTLDEGVRVGVAPDGQMVYVLAREEAEGTDTAVLHGIDTNAPEGPGQLFGLEGHTPDALHVASSGDMVYVATRDEAANAHLFAWDVAGQEVLEFGSGPSQGVFTSLVALEGDGEICGVGSTDADPFTGDVRVRCFDELSRALVADIVLPGSGTAITAEASSDGSRLYVAGAGENAQGAFGPWVHALDTSDGTVLWSHEGQQQTVFTGLDLAEDGSGLYVTGYAIVPGNAADAETTRLDPQTGEVEWSATYDQLRDLGTDVLVDAEANRVYTTGTAEDTILTIAHDTETGEEVWSQAREGGWSGSGWEIGRALALSPDGSDLYTMGTLPTHTAQGGIDYAVIGYDAATGEERWYNTYNGPGNDFDASWDMAIAPDGSALYVTGQSFDTFGAEDRFADGDPLVWYPRASDKNSMATVALDLTLPVVDDLEDEVRDLAP